MTTPDTDLSALERVQKLASQTLTDAELSRLATWARLTEPARRKEAESASAAAASATQELVEQLWSVQPDLRPDFTDTPEGAPAWVKPTSDFAAYPAGAHVEHQERIWRNGLDGLNRARPGEDTGWVDVTPIIPDGSRQSPWQWEKGMQVAAGDYVAHDSHVFIALDSHTTEETPDTLIGHAYERLS